MILHMPETQPQQTTATSPARRRAVTLYALVSSTKRSLDADVADWLEQGMSWRAIAAQIVENTEGDVALSHETLRTWYSTQAIA